MDKSNLWVARYTGIVMIATLVCRILGLGREMVISNQFGAGIETDAFFIAFMIPNLLRSFIGEGALNTAFIPIFSECLTNQDKKKADAFASNVLNILIIILVIIIIIGIWGAPWIIKIVAGGFKQDPEKYLLTVRLTRIMFPYIAFAAIAALFMGILNSYKQFFIPALAPAMLNIGIIWFAFLYGTKLGIYSLTIGVLIGGLAQVLIHIPSLWKGGFQYQLVLNFHNQKVKELFQILIPAIIALAIDKINFVVDRIIASYLAHGSISALYYANRLMQFPLGIFGIALSIAILPTLSEYVAKKQIGKMKESFSFGIKLLSLFTLPSTVALLVLSYPVVRLFYEHGLFNPQDTDLTKVALICYTIGLYALALLRLVISTFYALKDTKTPMKIGFLVVIFNIILDLILVRYLGHAGIALATSLAAIVHLIMLSIALQKKIKGLFTKELFTFFWKTGLACLLMGLFCWGVSQYFDFKFNMSLKIYQLNQVLISGIIGLMVYYFSGIMMGIPEFRNAKQIILNIIKIKTKEEDEND
ncbi:MAG: murein biosynthesis integral membrane protein MurJ [Candidatus Caldatribacteriota bacterium]|nr:murein biosynthesis integral membrane protein MurJ [Atribacterota bacterium]